MIQGPLHYVSDIRKGHSPASSPPRRGKSPLRAVYFPGFSLTRGPAQVEFLPTEASSTPALECLMGGPSQESQGLGVKQSLGLGQGPAHP